MKKQIITLLLLTLSIPAFAGSENPDPAEMKKNIEELTQYFEGKGYAFNQLLEDPRGLNWWRISRVSLHAPRKSGLKILKIIKGSSIMSVKKA